MIVFEPNSHKNQGIKHQERGGALIWILIMVALFAALTYAINQGSRGGSSQITEQQAQLAATEILNYARQIKNAVRTLQINGCSDAEIDHGNTVYKQENGTDNFPPGTNTDAPADGSCGIFNPNGGGLRPKVFASNEPTPSGASVVSGHATITIRDILGVGNDGNRETVFVVAGIDQSVCVGINDHLGIENPSGIPPVEVNTTPIIGDEATGLVGQTSFCLFRDASNKRHNFYQVLIAR